MPQRYNMGTPGVEAGDLKAMIDQMGQMMAMLTAQLAALDGTAKPATPAEAKPAASAEDDPLRRVDPWQAARPATGPPGMPIPTGPNPRARGPT